jgi:hypothetical protein
MVHESHRCSWCELQFTPESNGKSLDRVKCRGCGMPAYTIRDEHDLNSLESKKQGVRSVDERVVA